MRTRGTSCSLFRLLPAPQRAAAYLAAQEAVAEEAGGDVRDEVGWYHICALCQMSQHGDDAPGCRAGHGAILAVVYIPT